MKHSLRSVSFLITAFLLLSLIPLKDAQACTGVDLIITKITFTSVTSDTYTYTFEIKNIGTEAVPLKQISLQNYVAADAQGTDSKAAGGSVIVMSSNTDELAAGDTYTGTGYAYPNAIGNYPVSSYPYLLADVSAYPTAECNGTNNRLTVKIEATTTGTKYAAVAQATVNWNSDAKSFVVTDWQGSNTTALQYTIVGISGTVAASGNTRAGQSTSLAALQDGVYIIYLSDGDKVYSKKIIY